MNCPLCKTANLEKVLLEAELPSLKCDGCGGNWVSGSVYWNWLETHRHRSPVAELPVDEPVIDVEKAKLCPECRRIMVKYWVGHGIAFALDHCPSCRGIWFDRNEWDVLKSRNLHDTINSIFTAPWQSEVEREHRRKEAELSSLNKFGAEDYAEMKRIRRWLNQHPRREEILAYLSNVNPLD